MFNLPFKVYFKKYLNPLFATLSTSALLDNYPDTTGVEEILELPSKVEEQVLVNNSVIKPVYSDLDCNNHVNNTKYVEWALNLLDLSYINTHVVISTQVDYHKEIKYTDLVEVEYELKEDKLYVNYKVEEALAAVCLIEFKER